MSKLILPALLCLGLISCSSCNLATPEKKVQNALENLVRKSPEDAVKLSQVSIPITWRVGELKGATLAVTIVNHDKIQMVFDVQEAAKRSERLEPVISHEIAHAYDASVTYGVGAFIAKVEEDKNKPWAERELERSAVSHEDRTRATLLTHYPDEFRGMSPHRLR